MKIHEIATFKKQIFIDNLDMVLEINRKLQLVLEDTLLKNMMQQDNIKMLGKIFYISKFGGLFDLFCTLTENFDFS